MILNDRFEIHSHTHYSNLRLIDCINRPKNLINRAIEIGLKGITITDHDSLSSHMEVNMYAQELMEEHPNFKVALGNEIYLCGSRESGQKYYHFILIAKNKTGHRALRELSSRAWMNSYYDRGMERVVTLYEDLKEIVEKYPNSLIATTACLGGELSYKTSCLVKAEKVHNTVGMTHFHDEIINFVLYCKELFGEDFYIECAPGCSKDQIEVNKKLSSIANCFDVKMVVGSDAHFLKKEDRFVHKSYLNSKSGEREVDDFYEYSYLQTEEEIVEHLKESYFEEEIYKMFNNSMEIFDKIENYSLKHMQTIPRVQVKEYPITHVPLNPERYPVLCALMNSNDIVDRYWANQCYCSLLEKEYNGEIDDTKHDIYMDRLEEEADIKQTISEKLGTNMFAYPVTLQHYVDLFWECGSIVGAGRGSSCSGLNHYLLGRLNGYAH